MTEEQEYFSVYNFKNQLVDHDISMSFHGMLSQDVLSLIGQRLKNIPNSQVLSKRLFALAVEMTQNILHYSAQKMQSEKDGREVGVGVIAISETDEFHVISSGNYVHDIDAEAIVERVNYINSLSAKELKDYYREQRKAPQRANKPGANLGFIDMRRKSGNQLDVIIHETNDEHSFFILSVKIRKTVKMENFQIKGSTYIPRVDFNAETGILEIEGESYHEYTMEFFQPIFDWLSKYLAEPNRTITLNFKMSYFNTSSSRRFLEILTMLEDYQETKKGKVTVNWYYEESDIDMLESGEEYADDVDLEFNLIPFSN